MSSLGSSVTTEANEDDLATALGEAKKVKRWVQEIKFYETKSKQWEEKGKKILRRYKDDRSPREQKVPRFNILWSVIKSSQPALFAQNPKPDIERRFRDKDDLGRIASMVLERSITYFINKTFKAAVKQAVTDRLLPGRGTVWARYEPHFQDDDDQENENEETSDDGLEITDDAEPDDNIDSEPTQSLTGEDIRWDYVHWQDFGHTFGRTWEEVDAIWHRDYLTREELEERFGEEIGSKITLDYSPHDLKDNKYDEVQKKATIYEIWCKTDKTVYWIHKDHMEPLDEQYDPLGLDGFWPCPMPLYATLANDDMIPTPDYIEWQDQAAELDELTSRIGSITKAVKVAGIYDKSASGIERLLAEGVENQLIPVDQWAIFAEKGGIKGAMEILPMQEILETLLGLYKCRDQVKQDLYEISGSADIMRGQSDPDETATAQNIKSQFGTMRLDDMQDQVKDFCRDLVQIGTQIIANHFSLETIKKICGVQLLTEQEKQIVQIRMKALQQYAQQQKAMQPKPPQPGQPPQPPPQQMPPPQLPPLPDWLQKCDQEDMDELMDNPTWEEVDGLLHDEIMLGYKIDIETESTIKMDQDKEKAARVEFLETVGKFMQAMTQNQNPDLAPLLGKLLEFGVRGFRIGKELETAFDVAIHKLEKDAADPAKQKPDPEMAKIKGDQEIAQQRLQADMQLEAQKSQAEDKRIQLQAQTDNQQLQMQTATDKFKIQEQGQLDLQKAKMDNETKIIVAKIGAGAKSAAEGGADASIPASNDLGIMGPSLNDLMKTVITQMQQTFSGMQQSNQAVMNSHQAMIQAMNRPKQIIRDANGDIAAVH